MCMASRQHSVKIGLNPTETKSYKLKHNFDKRKYPKKKTNMST